jgi:hypothetical protein
MAKRAVIHGDRKYYDAIIYIAKQNKTNYQTSPQNKKEYRITIQKTKPKKTQKKLKIAKGKRKANKTNL